MNFDSAGIRPVRPFLIAVAAIVAMSLAADVLKPIALAVLFAFILDPAVTWFERRGLKRPLAVLVTMVLVVVAVAGVGYIVGSQFVALADDLPSLESNVVAKLDGWFKPAPGSTVARLARLANHLRESIVPSSSASAPAVRIVAEPAQLARLQSVLSPLQRLAAFLGITWLLLFFVLVARDDVNDRLVRLVGRGQIGLATRTLRQIGHRLSHYLARLTLFNMGFGLVLGLGLWSIGLTYAALWGVLGAFLRFIPYLGPLIALALPLLFSVAEFTGWWGPALVLLLIVVMEGVANTVEPLLYGRSAGVSSLGLLVATMFWTMLWGDLGLLMSVPLTLGLTVLAQHIPSLNFVATLLGEGVEVDDDLKWYQRVVSRDQDGAVEFLDAALENQGLESVCDQILIPALSRAEQDRASGALEPNDVDFLERVVRDWLDDVAARGEPSSPVTALPEIEPPPQVVGVAAASVGDALVLQMIDLLLGASGVRIAIVASSESPLALSDRVFDEQPTLVLLSHVPPVGLAHARFLSRRLRARLPKVPLLVGFWDVRADAAWALETFRAAKASRVALSVAAARDMILESITQKPRTATATADRGA
jgi:predicted PurR-regulated permease PerM